MRPPATSYLGDIIDVAFALGIDGLVPILARTKASDSILDRMIPVQWINNWCVLTGNEGGPIDNMLDDWRIERLDERDG